MNISEWFNAKCDVKVVILLLVIIALIFLINSHFAEQCFNKCRSEGMVIDAYDMPNCYCFMALSSVDGGRCILRRVNVDDLEWERLSLQTQ